MIPLYGFLQGDTLGLLIVSHADERVEELIEKLQTAARLRVAARARLCLVHKGRALSPLWTVREAGIQALDRFDVVEET